MYTYLYVYIMDTAGVGLAVGRGSLAWTCSESFGLTWIHLDSMCFFKLNTSSLELTWTYLVSPGSTLTHLPLSLIHI